MILFAVMFCGEAFALPQDWPCDEFVFSTENCKEDDVCYFYTIQGDYKVRVYSDIRGDCGTAGCRGTIKNLKTNVTESLKFGCWRGGEKNQLICQNYVGEEYWFRKFNDDEYRMYLCGDGYYNYVKLSECTDCHCTMKDSEGNRRYSTWELNCRLDGDILYCVNFQVYEANHLETYKEGDYENCVDLGGF